MVQNYKDLFFLTSLSFVSLLQGGGCIQDGMNLWKLSENIACSVGSYCELKQATFPVTISASGHYKLCEDISSVGGASLSITASNVILDFGGYSLTNINIVVSAGVSDIIIGNGTIANTTNPVTINSNTQNILVENLIIDT